MIAIAAGKDFAVNGILGMLFITSMNMVFDFNDNIATCNAIDHSPFAIDLCCTARTVPASFVGVNAGITVNPVVAELEDYEQWRSSQVDLTHSNQTQRVCFCNDANNSADNVSLPTASPSFTSEAQTILHHNVQHSGDFM